MRRACLPIKYSQGFHPLPRIIFNEALPVGMESLGQFCDVELTQRLNVSEIAGMINPHLPEGLKVISAKENTSKNIPIDDIIKRYVVRFPGNSGLDFPGIEEVNIRIDDFNACREFPVQMVKKGKIYPIDIKQTVQKIALGENSLLEIELRPTERKAPRLTEIVGWILGLKEKEKQALRITKLSN
jgi:radical SAM-linked protein